MLKEKRIFQWARRAVWTYDWHRTKGGAAFVAHHRKVLVLARDPDGVLELPIGDIPLGYMLDEFLILLQCLNVAGMVREY
jgi:glutamine phosphoribosylpyrophosphate amidotransferase